MKCARDQKGYYEITSMEFQQITSLIWDTNDELWEELFMRKQGDDLILE
jgi:hypothetical protein